ncbi:class I SAM-dependent RNA methyltransferase [bacterium]|nr:class I SAM-dependent RNA methyltransferase [bacterium]
MKFNLTATCSLGLEAVAARELKRLGMQDIRSENGRVNFTGNASDLCRANMWLRSADRVWWRIKTFSCRSFEDLFLGLKSIPWAQFLPVDSRFPVDAHSYNSALTSLPAIQRTAKKAVVEVMQNYYRRTVLSEEGQTHFPIKIFLVKDVCEVMADTSGSGLHRRGYRTLNAAAPLRETLAAALVQLSYWNKDRILVDPFCGSGTIAIEAAMIGLNMAPGLTRKFAAETWPFIEREAWQEALQEAEEGFDRRSRLQIYGFDKDPQVLKLARFHLRQSNLENRGIEFAQKDAVDFQSRSQYGVVITNPPYGQRLLEMEEAEGLYEILGRIYEGMPTWSYYIISSHPEFEDFFAHKAYRKRKVYNGMIACNYFQYPGPKPPNI